MYFVLGENLSFALLWGVCGTGMCHLWDTQACYSLGFSEV